jgi:hypothetical protein
VADSLGEAKAAFRAERPLIPATNFGLLLLTFALWVIVSHNFNIMDGDNSREPLNEIFERSILFSSSAASSSVAPS